MTAATPGVLAGGTQPSWQRWLRRHGWTVGVWLLLLVLIGYYSTLIPAFGSFQVASIVNNGAPLVFLAAAQAIIVIAGGIDLGVGGMLVLTSVTAARLMEGQPLIVTLLIAIGLLGAAALKTQGVPLLMIEANWNEPNDGMRVE